LGHTYRYPLHTTRRIIMKGYKTLITNIVALLASLAVLAGVDVPLETQSQISTGVLALVNIGLRFSTDTAAGKSE